MVMSRKVLRGSMLGTATVAIMFLVFLGIFAFTFMREYNFYRNAEKVYGVVDDITRSVRYSRRGGNRITYTIYVSYTTIDNKSFSRVKATYNNVSASSYSKGDGIIVAYDVNNPTKVGVGNYSPNIAKIVVLVIFSALCGFMIYLTLKTNKKMKTIKYLMNNGIRSDAEITNISSSRSGKNTYYIVECIAHNPFNGQIMSTQSGKITSIKGLGINKHLDAYFDPNEPEIYFINLE